MEKDAGSNRSPEVPDPRELLLDEEDPMDEGGGDPVGMGGEVPTAAALAIAAAIAAAGQDSTTRYNPSAAKRQEGSVLPGISGSVGYYGNNSKNMNNPSCGNIFGPSGSTAGGSGSGVSVRIL